MSQKDTTAGKPVDLAEQFRQERAARIRTAERMDAAGLAPAERQAALDRMGLALRRLRGGQRDERLRPLCRLRASARLRLPAFLRAGRSRAMTTARMAR